MTTSPATFDKALLAARAQLETPHPLPTFEEVEIGMRGHDRDRELPAGSRWLASLAAVLALTTMATDAIIGAQLGVPLLFALILPVLVLGASAVLVHRDTLGPQLFCRAAWWAHLMLGFAWSWGAPDSLPAGGTVLALASGVALLSAGREGLLRDDTARVFDPVAFRGTVLLGMLLGLADAQLLAQLGLTFLEADAADGHPVLFLSCAVLLAIGVWGLARLRVWAVGLNLLTHLLVLVAVVWVSGRSSPLLWVIGGGATLQLLLPLRMLIAFRRGAPRHTRGRELSSRVPNMIIAALMLACIPVGLLGTYAPLLP